MKNFKSSTLVVALAAGLSAAAIAHAAVGDSGASVNAQAQASVSNFVRDALSTTPTAPTAAEVKSLAGEFAVFSRAQTPADVPTAAQLSPDAATRGYTASQTRQVGASGSKVFATPVAGGVCISSPLPAQRRCLPSFGLATDNTGGAIRGLQATICGPGLDPSQIIIYGFIPDGVSSLTFTRADGETATAPVTNNFVQYTDAKSDSPITGISWTGADGSAQSADSPVPPDASSNTCG